MRCIWCGEEVLPEERMVEGGELHRECMVRSIIGSLAHLKRECSCYIRGSCEGDPPGTTKREGARLAYHYYRASMSSSRN